MPFCCTQGSAEVRARRPVASVWESWGRHALPVESSRAPSKKCIGFHVFVMTGGHHKNQGIYRFFGNLQNYR